MSSPVELQEIRREQREEGSIFLDQIRFHGSPAVAGGRFRILMNGKKVSQKGTSGRVN